MVESSAGPTGRQRATRIYYGTTRRAVHRYPSVFLNTFWAVWIIHFAYIHAETIHIPTTTANETSTRRVLVFSVLRPACCCCCCSIILVCLLRSWCFRKGRRYSTPSCSYQYHIHTYLVRVRVLQHQQLHW